MKNKIKYEGGRIVLNDGITFVNFKECSKNFLDDTLFDVIDTEDNLIRISYRNVLYIFFINDKNKRKESIIK
jgi:hypothetical protein